MGNQKGKGGRPEKLTPSVQEKIVDAIKLGSYYEPACLYAGISYRSFRRWIVRGEREKLGRYRQFCQAVKKAEGEAELRMITKIQQVGNAGQWQALAWTLERRHPDRWARKEHPAKEEPEEIKPVKVIKGVRMDEL